MRLQAAAKIISVPLYEYQCKKCGHRFERIQKFSDPLVKKCPECGAAVEQLLSAPAVQFKGSGWYVTDYARKSSAPASDTKHLESSDGAGEKKTEAGETKSEAKPKHEPKKSHKK
jgi:putative FmdB family regulatory protein